MPSGSGAPPPARRARTPCSTGKGTLGIAARPQRSHRRFFFSLLFTPSTSPVDFRARRPECAVLTCRRDPAVVPAEHACEARLRCALRRWAPFEGVGSSSSMNLIGVGNISAPTCAAGSSGNRSWNCGSSSNVFGVFAGAIGVLCSSPNASHSARRARREDVAEDARAIPCCLVRDLRTAIRASVRTGRGGRRRRRSSARTRARTP